MHPDAIRSVLLEGVICQETSVPQCIRSAFHYGHVMTTPASLSDLQDVHSVLGRVHLEKGSQRCAHMCLLFGYLMLMKPLSPGTDITLFGTLVLPLDQSVDIPDATYSVILDGTATTNFIASLSKPAIVQDAATDILVSFRNLQDGQHTLQVVLHNPADTDDVGNSTSGPMIAFDRAVVQVGAGMPK